MAINPYYGTAWGNETLNITIDQKEVILTQALEKLQHLSLSQVSMISKLQNEVIRVVRDTIDRAAIHIDENTTAEIVDELIGRIAGFEYLMPILRREDLSEIAITSQGQLWIMKKGEMTFELLLDKVDYGSTQRVIEALLRANNRSLSEATPILSGKVSRTPQIAAIRGGARVHIVHQSLCAEGGPSINLRFFEPKPVQPQNLIEWELAPASVIEGLLMAVAREARVMVIGGTASGKTTLLSALCSAIPKDKRVVKIEDPEEIWLDHPHVMTMEARAATPGSTLAPVRLADCVDSAMRMTPQWLILGEVRDGQAAQALFRAQMSDHPGLSTFHAQSPDACVQRLVNIMGADCGTRAVDAKQAFAMGVDVLTQVGNVRGKRRLLGVWHVDEVLKGNEVQFFPLYRWGDSDMLAWQPGGMV